MAWDREFEVLEEAIHRVTAEYDAFLYGSAAKPPVESRKHVEQMIRKLSSVTFDVAADRYRFATLQGRYTALTERWERLQSEKESGRRPGLYGHFVPPGKSASAAPPRDAPGFRPPNAGAARSVEASEAGLRSDRQLYEKFVSARKARGESVEGYAYEKFAENLERERARIQERLGSAEVVFDVAERDGKVKLIARKAAAAEAPGETK